MTGRDPFEITMDEVAKINALAAMMNSKTAHEDDADSDPPGAPIQLDVCAADGLPIRPRAGRTSDRNPR